MHNTVLLHYNKADIQYFNPFIWAHKGKRVKWRDLDHDQFPLDIKWDRLPFWAILASISRERS